MDNPVVFPFLNADGDEDFTIAAAGIQIGQAVEDLEGLLSLGLYALFSVGTASSGAGVTVYIQTSFAGGAWFDIASFAFADVTASSGANVVASSSRNPIALLDQALADNTVLDGPIGDRVRAVVVTDGTFSGPTVLSLRGNAR